MRLHHQRGPGDPATSSDKIIEYFRQHPDSSVNYAARLFHADRRRVEEAKRKARRMADSTKLVKKTGKVDWREHVAHAKETQRLKRKASWSQDQAVVDIQRLYGTKKPIVIQFISDLHIGSMATNYRALEEITDGVLRTPNLFWVLNGDLTETTAIFRNALAVHSQVADIETQHDILESWLGEIAHKVISAGWDNHGVEREEKIGAFSHIKRLLNRRFIYHNGMGRIDIVHGKARYKLLVSHAIAGASIFNHLHGAKRLIRLEFPDVDICATGDKHTPDIETYYEGEFRRVALMGGAFKTDDGYSKRYFSLFTHMDMPAVVLFPDEKFFAVYMTAAEALAVASGLKEKPSF